MSPTGIKKLRYALGISRAQLGDELGLTARTIGEFERDERVPPDRVMAKLLRLKEGVPEPAEERRQVLCRITEEQKGAILAFGDGSFQAGVVALADAILDGTLSALVAECRADAVARVALLRRL